MNKRLAEFLIALVRDPERLSAFNDTESGREAVLRDADLEEADKTALRSVDASDVLHRLQTDDDGVTWVIAPGIKKFTVGFTVAGGIKATDPPAAASRAMATEGAGIKAMATEGAGIKAMATEGAGIKDTADQPARGAAKKKAGTSAAKPAGKKAASKKSSSRKSAPKPRR
jgi:hypothetical protein